MDLMKDSIIKTIKWFTTQWDTNYYHPKRLKNHHAKESTQGIRANFEEIRLLKHKSYIVSKYTLIIYSNQIAYMKA